MKSRPGILPALVLAAGLWLSPAEIHGQMFSVEERSPYDRQMYRSSLGAGWEIGDFSYHGDPDEAGDDRYDFNMGIFRLHFENPGVNVYFGIAGRMTGSENQNYLNLGVELYNDFLLTGSSELDVPRLFIPLQISTDLLRTNRDMSSREFQQTSFKLSGGLGLHNRFHENFRGTFRILPGFGFTNSQGAFIGGYLASVQARARFHLLNLVGDKNFVIGYDYRFSRYNIDLEIFNYDLRSHSVTLGIAL